MDTPGDRVRPPPGVPDRCPRRGRAARRADPAWKARQRTRPGRGRLRGGFGKRGAAGLDHLHQHSQETHDQARALLDVLRPNLPDGAALSAVTAAYLHETVKAHPVWQNALCGLAAPGRGDETRRGPWAKSGSERPLRFNGNAAFRHELASLLLLDGPLSALLAGLAEPDLARYLILAHHGRLRIQVRDPGDATPGSLLGLAQGETTPIPGVFGLPRRS